MSNAQRGLARVQAVDVRFVDLIGLWQHFTASTSACGPTLGNLPCISTSDSANPVRIATEFAELASFS